MAYYADRVKDTSTTTGTGSFTLAGSAPSGYQTFATGLGSASVQTEYCIAGQTGTEWEVGRGTFNGTTTLTRDQVRGSSNSGALVNFSAGTKDVFVTMSAEQADNANMGMLNAMSMGWAMP